MDKKVNEKKKKYAIVITFLVLMICITGGTYAYFALTASNNSVTGSVGGASLNLTVTKVYPTSEHNNKNMIPQLESTLDEAISLEHKCVDGNGNVICQVYSATVTNVGSTSSVLNGTINFTGIEREAGLYDENWNMIVSWDSLVDDYGLKIDEYGDNQTYSLAYIINNNQNQLSGVSKIIVDSEVNYVGLSQFYGLTNIEEIVLPNDIRFDYIGELGGLDSLKNIYYSGNDFDGLDNGWGSYANILSNISIMNAMPNLKWMRINDSNTIGTYASFQASTEKALFEENKIFGANTSNTYYFVFWIDETGDIQTDNGTFRANIEFNSAGDGLTSTVRPNGLPSGLYKEDGTFVSWEQLTSMEYQTVTYKDENDEVLTGAIINVDENGVLTTAFDLRGFVNNSESYLDGSLVLDDSVKKLGTGLSIGEFYGAFDGCGLLDAVTIPTSVTSIGTETFDGTMLEEIYYLGTKEQWNNIEFGDNWNFGPLQITVHCTDGDIVYDPNPR
jgi:hypothetical protein